MSNRARVRQFHLGRFSLFMLALAGPGIAEFAVAAEESMPGSGSEKTATPPSDALQEIIVTARRTQESLQEVPISISVLDADALAERGIKTTNDLVLSVPGLSGSSVGSRSSTSFSMRGQGQAYATSLPGVLTYLAEVPDFSTFLYDFNSVQVLKGPQGTLFGRNTTGGAVLFTPVRPTGEFDGYVNARLGRYDQQDFEFAVGGELLSDKLTARLAGQRLKRDGFTKNLFPGGHDLDDEDRYSVRLSLVATPTEALENYTLIQYDHIDEGGSANVLQAFVDAPTTPFIDVLGPFLELQNERGPRKVEHDASGSARFQSLGVINNTKWTLNDQWSLTNIVSYRHSRNRADTDLDGSPYPIESIIQRPEPVRNVSEELQAHWKVGRYESVAGLYYETVRQLPVSILQVPLCAGCTSTFVLPSIFLSGMSRNDNSKALYLQTSISDFLVDGLTLTAGYRHTRDQRSAHLSTTISVPAFGVEIVLAPLTLQKLEQEANTWNLSAAYQFTPDLMGYVSARRGYKGGGFNITADPERIKYDPEYVIDYEAGIKSQWSVGSWQMRLNGAVYYDDYTDIQRNLNLGDPPAQIVVNAAKAKIKGLDLDFLVVPAPWLEVALQYAYIDPKYDSYVDAFFGDLSDSKFPNTPKQQVTFAPTVHTTLPNDWGSLSFSAPFYWQSKISFQIPNVLNGDPQNDPAVAGSVGKSFHKLDLRADWRDIRGSGFSAAMFVRNVTDETYPIGALNSMGVETIASSIFLYSLPRMYGVELHYDF